MAQQRRLGMNVQVAAQAEQSQPSGAGAGHGRLRHGSAATGTVAEHEAAEPEALPRKHEGIATGLSQGGMALPPVLGTAEPGNDVHSTHPS